MSRRSIQRNTQKQGSISTKISMSMLVVLIPSLIILILVACLLASRSISSLNAQIMEAQTKNAVSTVDSFFESKIMAARMFEADVSLQAYFSAVDSEADIKSYADMDVVVTMLSDTLQRMTSEKVTQAWVADQRSDTYLLSTGETVAAGFSSVSWDEEVSSTKSPVVTDPFLDPATGKQVISVVVPVLNASGNSVVGMFGFDVFMDDLSSELSTIKLGKQGYLELISNNGDYIYSADPTAMGKNVSELDISQAYKENVNNKFQGVMDLSYGGAAYTSLFLQSNSTGWLAVGTMPISEINATRNQLIFVLVALSAVLLIALIFLIIGLIRRTLNPLVVISGKVEEFAQGDLNVDIQNRSNDEIGQLAESVRSAISAQKEIIGDISRILTEISVGNLKLRVEGNYMGDFLPIRQALEKIIYALNDTMGQISIGADQVNSGSDQVSSGAQALSQGATEQASSIEELAAAINDISNQIKESAQHAAQANEQMDAVGNEAEESNRRMQAMLEAIEEIKNSAGEIGKIIKTIEDIAFQTNILALNAAVEAARAGTAGKGFAVVADEVRSLANKSQEASKSTSALIERALQAVENGTHIADETAHSLSEVVSGVSGIRGAISLISSASAGQAQSIAQVTAGVDQISAVVQTNSATAEESAAASEELSSQSQILRDLVGKFQVDDQMSTQAQSRGLQV